MPSFGIGMRCFVLAWALGPALLAQDGDMAERLFSSGERAYAAKAYPEALETWNQLIQGSPKSPFAAHALLRLAKYQIEIEKKPEAAMPLLDRIKAEHLKTPWAPEALLLRGQILADRRNPQDLKEAMAEFNRLLDLFPDSSEIQDARFRIAQGFFLQGQWGRALQNATDVQRMDPGSPLAVAAQLQLAETLDIMGDTPGCLRALQALRNRAPQSPEAAEATWREALILKQRILKPALRSEGPWPQGKMKWLKTPTLLATGPGGELYIYQDDLDRAYQLQDGQVTPVGPAAKGAKAMFVTRAGQVWLVTPKLGLIKDEVPAAPPAVLPAQSPSGAFQDGWGNVWIGDARGSNLQILPPDGPGRTLPGSATALAPLPGGGAVVATEGRTLQFLDAEGRAKASVPYGKDLPAPFKTVLALASDPCGHVAGIVDGDFEGVILWGPDGSLLRFATFKTLGISGKFRAIALDRQGGIILADRSNDQLIRLN